MRHRGKAVQGVVAVADGLGPRRGHAALVAQNVVVVADRLAVGGHGLELPYWRILSRLQLRYAA